MTSRNEGAGILLDARAGGAWRQGGEVWKAVSSRVVMARLKWISEGEVVTEGSQMCLYCVLMLQLPGLLHR